MLQTTRTRRNRMLAILTSWANLRCNPQLTFRHPVHSRGICNSRRVVRPCRQGPSLGTENSLDHLLAYRSIAPHSIAQRRAPTPKETATSDTLERSQLGEISKRVPPRDCWELGQSRASWTRWKALAFKSLLRSYLLHIYLLNSDASHDGNDSHDV